MSDAEATPAGQPARGPGRPRAEGHDERILAAVLELIDAGRPVTVSAVVRGSGVSRSALYRRWPSMTDLIAAALDHGRAPVTAPVISGSVTDTIIALYVEHAQRLRGEGYPDHRFRRRIALSMEDPEIQRAYWNSHVRRRRRAMLATLEEGVRRGELREGVDLEACVDLLNGVLYYEAIVRGAEPDRGAALRRRRAALEVALRGMQA